FTRHQLVVVKSLRWLVRCRLQCTLSRRHPGFNPTAKALTKHADRAEFDCSREFIAAARTGAWCRRAHGPNRRSDATRASQRVKCCPLLAYLAAPTSRYEMMR